MAALNSTSLCSMEVSKVLRLLFKLCCSQCAPSLDATRILCSMCVCFTLISSRMCFIACATGAMCRGEGGGVGGGEGETAGRLANRVRIHTYLIAYTIRIPSNAIQTYTNPIQINANTYTKFSTPIQIPANLIRISHIVLMLHVIVHNSYCWCYFACKTSSFVSIFFRFFLAGSMSTHSLASCCVPYASV